MTIFSIADLHLDTGDKPMDVFGPQWAGHFDRIKEDWLARVTDRDVVLMPGDLSWAMQLGEVEPHLRMIGELPGQKIILKGNHDYWWSSISRVRDMLSPGTHALQNDALLIGGVLFAGTRGWVLPGGDGESSDRKIYERELIRLDMSMKAARKLSQQAPLVCMMHYPPLTPQKRESGFTELMGEYGAKHCVYGHLHGAAIEHAYQGVSNGVGYKLVSCDGLGFRLYQFPEDSW